LHRTLKSLLPNKITTTRILLHTQSTLWKLLFMNPWHARVKSLPTW
jgi:hypothetical protein